MVFCLAVHQFALKTWFFQDDFAWLALRLGITSPGSLWQALFSPKAEGTIRTLSERLYFLVFSSLFGLDAVPFKVWAFLTQLANITLLIQIAKRLTGSTQAGFLSAILWTANAGLALALGWSSAYNEVAFAFVVLLAFRLLLLYIDTGQQKYWIWQWIVFLIGFGVLELNVSYPVLAAGYCLCCARNHLRKSLYLFIPSILFGAAHFLFIDPPADPHYKMYFGWTPLSMLWSYWVYSLSTVRDFEANAQLYWLGLSLAIGISVSFAIFAVNRLRRRDWLPVYLLSWFFAVIAPILPLRDHFTEYYVVVPSIGLAILGAWAIAGARRPLAVASSGLAVLYCVVSISSLQLTEKYFYNRGRSMKYLVTGLEAFPGAKTSRAILLDGVNSDLFWSGVSDDPFRLVGISRVYLTPGSEMFIDPHPEWGGISRFVISTDDAKSLLANNQALVVAFQGRELRDITSAYLAKLRFVSNHPEFVAVANPLYGNRLGPTWYPIEQDFRWMPKTATVRIAGPKKTGQMLEVTGYTPAVLVARGPLVVSLRGDGIDIGSASLNRPNQDFNLKFPLPSSLVGRPVIELQIEVSHTILAGRDPRTLGLVIQTFTIR